VVPNPRNQVVLNSENRWSPTQEIDWSLTAEILHEHLLQNSSHPEQGYRACLGLLSLARQYGQERLEAASALAVKLQSPTRKSVLSILKTGRDQEQTGVPEQLDRTSSLPSGAVCEVLACASAVRASLLEGRGSHRVSVLGDRQVHTDSRSMHVGSSCSGSGLR